MLEYGSSSILNGGQEDPRSAKLLFCCNLIGDCGFEGTGLGSLIELELIEGGEECSGFCLGLGVLIREDLNGLCGAWVRGLL